MSVRPMTRRSVLSGSLLVAAAGVAGFAWARSSEAADNASPSTRANGYGAPATDTGRVLTNTADVPPGGGVVLGDAGVVVTRDDGGSIHAFSAACTHQGCSVSSVRDGVINCPCHGSQFDAGTGAPVRGPATRPLAEVAITIRGDQIVRS